MPSSDRSFFSSSDSIRVRAFLDDRESVVSGEGGEATETDALSDSKSKDEKPT